jgi:hypothetical protein
MKRFCFGLAATLVALSLVNGHALGVGPSGGKPSRSGASHRPAGGTSHGRASAHSVTSARRPATVSKPAPRPQSGASQRASAKAANPAAGRRSAGAVTTGRSSANYRQPNSGVASSSHRPASGGAVQPRQSASTSPAGLAAARPSSSQAALAGARQNRPTALASAASSPASAPTQKTRQTASAAHADVWNGNSSSAPVAPSNLKPGTEYIPLIGGGKAGGSTASAASGAGAKSGSQGQPGSKTGGTGSGSGQKIASATGSTSSKATCTGDGCAAGLAAGAGAASGPGTGAGTGAGGSKPPAAGAGGAGASSSAGSGTRGSRNPPRTQPQVIGGQDAIDALANAGYDSFPIGGGRKAVIVPNNIGGDFGGIAYGNPTTMTDPRTKQPVQVLNPDQVAVIQNLPVLQGDEQTLRDQAAINHLQSQGYATSDGPDGHFVKPPANLIKGNVETTAYETTTKNGATVIDPEQPVIVTTKGPPAAPVATTPTTTTPPVSPVVPVTTTPTTTTPPAPPAPPPLAPDQILKAAVDDAREKLLAGIREAERRKKQLDDAISDLGLAQKAYKAAKKAGLGLESLVIDEAADKIAKKTGMSRDWARSIAKAMLDPTAP